MQLSPFTSLSHISYQLPPAPNRAESPHQPNGRSPDDRFYCSLSRNWWQSSRLSALKLTLTPEMAFLCRVWGASVADGRPAVKRRPGRGADGR